MTVPSRIKHNVTKMIMLSAWINLLFLISVAIELNFPNETTYLTDEFINEDGTYGNSTPYIFWFDVRGVFHQQFLSDVIIHISDQPLAVKSIVLNIEATTKEVE